MGFGGFFQPTHLLFILVIALLVLGPKRLPEVAKTLGRGLRDFKDALSTDDLDWRHESGGQATDTPDPHHEIASQGTEARAEPTSAPRRSAWAPEPAASVEPASEPLVSATPAAESAEPAKAIEPASEAIAHAAD